MTRQLVLTGQRKKRRVLVTLDHKEIWLTTSLFRALVELVIAKATGTGETELSPVIVYRLRCDLTADLIETSGSSQYVLLIDTENIYLNASLVKSNRNDVLTELQFEQLVQLKSSRNMV